MTMQATRALFFQPGMQPDRAKQRYHALVRVLHPDVETGDTALMQRLNIEFEAYERGTLLPAVVEATPPPSSPPPYTSWYVEAVQKRARELIQVLPHLPGVWYETDALERLILARQQL